ncbi:hypothetical protein NHX12_003948, partial [Muraenolepis orangiensis]
MAAVLLQVLERTELNKLPKSTQNKLERHLTELQTQHERLRADWDQQNFEVEKRLTESRDQFLSTARELQSLKEDNRRLDEELVTLKGIEGDSPDDKQPEQTKAKYEIEAERRELARLLEKKTQDLDHLTGETDHLTGETDHLTGETDHLTGETTSQTREQRVLQEKLLLQQQTEWLTSELTSKTEELLTSERKSSQETLELRCDLDTTTEQVSRLESQLTALKVISDGHYKRAEDLNTKLKQCKEQQIVMEEKYRTELNAHIKLSSLYKGAASDSEAKNQELSRAVEELSKLVKDTGEVNTALQKKVSEGEELKSRAPSLTEEQLDSMCPSAAAIADIVKPGMKFFELYNAFASAQTQLQLEKQESRRVSRVLDEVVLEVEAKAPVLKRQREEYEAMQRSLASLCTKLEAARDEIHGLQKEKEEVKQRCSDLAKEKLRTERQLEDTSTQLCSLLVEKEEQRGVRVTKEEATSSDVTTSSELAGQHQISFSSVEQLQRQNQTLLGQLRDLEEERDRQHTLITSSRVCELELRMEQLQKEVEQLKEQRNQQKQLADSSCRQRDMYRTEVSPQPSRTPIPATRSTPQRSAEAAQMAQAKAALKQLSETYSVYKQQKSENDRMVNETTERLQQEVTQLRSGKAKMAASIEFSNKRYDMLQDTLSAYRREISTLQGRASKMSALSQQQENIVHTLSHDLRLTNEKLALQEVRVEHISKEKDLLRQRISSKAESLEAELVAMKTKLDQEVQQRHTLGRSMDAQLLEAKKQLESQNVLQLKTRELLKTSEQQVVSLRTQLASAATSSTEMVTVTTAASGPAVRGPGLRALPRGASAPSPPSQQEVSELKERLRGAEEQSGELNEQLRSATASVEQYKAVVLSLEDSLKKEKQRRLAAEAQSKYERELMLHAADVEALQALKKQSQKEASLRRSLEEQLSSTSSTLRVNTAGWTALERNMKEDLAHQAQRSEDLVEQNSLLHQQMDKMASRTQQQRPPSVSFSEEGKNTQQILEILRLVRREKDIAVAQSEASDGEAQRCRRRAEDQETDLKDLQDVLHAERDRMQGLLRTMSQQEERLKNLEDIKVVQESNRLLKAHRDRLELELQQATAKSERLGSLQADKRLLEDELKRWRTRAQQLMSQQKDSDVEEKQKLANEREAQQKRISHLAEETARLKTDLARSTASSNSAQAQLLGLRDSVARLSSERDNMKKDLETKNNELLEKNKTITQVKKIGRRYKTQYDELKVQHDKLVEESAAKPRSDAASGQEVSQELSQAREELNKTKEELNSHKEEVQRKQQEEVHKLQQDMEEVQKENQMTKEQLQEVQTQASQNQGQLTQVQSQLLQNQLKSAQAQARQNHLQQVQREQQNLVNQKELQQTQQSHNQEVNTLKAAVSQSESKVSELQSQLDGQQKTSEREAEYKQLQDQLAAANQANDGSPASQSAPASDATAANKALQEELAKIKQELCESSSREEQLRQQMTDKEDKIKKTFHGAKTKIHQLNSAKEKLSQQYEGRLLRLDRELRERRGTTGPDGLEEAPDQSSNKREQRSIKVPSSLEGQRSIKRSIKVPSSLEDQRSIKVSDHPSTTSPSNKPSPAPGNKATPRASIRPMVTPATVSMPTPTATVMPTTQTDNQEVVISTSSSVHSTSSGPVAPPTSLSQPTGSQATAFVQPTQQQASNQEVASSMEQERPSTSSPLIGGPKRGREDGEEEPETSQTLPSKKLRVRQTVTLLEEGDAEGEREEEMDRPDSVDHSQEIPDGGLPVLAEEESEEVGVSQSEQATPKATTQARDVIVIDTDSESRESKEEEKEEEEE